jgi:hypothetical protein
MTTESEAPCNCRDWAENIPYLDDMLLLRWLHGGKQYEGKPFVYCPWCGTRLTSASNDRDEARLAACRQQIEESFFRRDEWGSPEPPDMLLADRLVEDYRQATGDMSGTLDLMLFFVETGTRFTLKYGDVDESFYKGLEMMLEEFTRLLLTHRACYEDANLALRLAKLARNASGIGWGYGDYVREQIETVQEQFGDI